MERLRNCGSQEEPKGTEKLNVNVAFWAKCGKMMLSVN